MSDLDKVTGLLRRDVLFEHGAALLERARDQRRDVALVSVFVNDVDSLDCGYAEAERNVLLATFAAELANVADPDDVVGRIGLAEMIVVTTIDTRNSAARRMADGRRRVNVVFDEIPAAADVGYSIGLATSHGRSVDLDQLVKESRNHRLARAA